MKVNLIFTKASLPSSLVSIRRVERQVLNRLNRTVLVRAVINTA